MTNDDLISRAAVLECMKSMAGCATCDNYNYVRCRACSWDDAMNIVDEVHAVDAIPVIHARWCEEQERTNHWHCGNCGFVEGIVSRFYNYCPNCGAKMDGERRDDDAK